MQSLVHGDHDTRRQRFPVVDRFAYFAHAAVAPYPAAVSDAIRGYADRVGSEGQFDHVLGDTEPRCRDLAAQVFGVRSEEVAFVPSTSAGLGTVSAGIAWRAGDNVIVGADEFPSNVYPWLDLRRLGVEVRMLPDDWGDAGDVEKLVDRRTRLVALSSRHYVTGRPVFGLCELGMWLRERSVLLCVDAIQSAGNEKICGEHVDFIVADGHKWLLAPKGIGILTVREASMTHLRPATRGWKSVPDPKNLSLQEGWAADAKRYEPGSLNEIGLVGLCAALDIIVEAGLDTIATSLSNLREHLLIELDRCGAGILGEPRHARWGPIISFQLPGEDPAKTMARLRRADIVASLREYRGDQYVRLSPHFYVTLDEVAHLGSVLRHTD